MGSLPFAGRITSVQPRVMLTRSFDEKDYSYRGFTLRIDGEVDGVEAQFSVGIGAAVQSRFGFRVNDLVSGRCRPITDKRIESVDYCRASALKKLAQGPEAGQEPPWEQAPDSLDIYEEEGPRRLSARSYSAKCKSCMWGAKMAVEIIVDHWDPRGPRRYRQETFCFGPRDCRFYKPGPARRVEGRKGMVYVDEEEEY